MLGGLRILYDPKGRLSQALPSVIRNDSDDPKRSEVAVSGSSYSDFFRIVNVCYCR